MMYDVYHEMDITRFSADMEEEIHRQNQITRLASYRKVLGISQAELARRAQVPLRQIQLFEQRSRDINKTSSSNLQNLSKILCCTMEDLMERSEPGSI